LDNPFRTIGRGQRDSPWRFGLALPDGRYLFSMQAREYSDARRTLRPVRQHKIMLSHLNIDMLRPFAECRTTDAGTQQEPDQGTEQKHDASSQLFFLVKHTGNIFPVYT
jgi:hypothetical protein